MAMTKILLVDNEVRALEGLSRTLQMMGYHPVGASDPKIAQDLLRTGRYDILITDLIMPEVDGIGLLEFSKKIDPDLPVIILTGYGTVKSAVDAMKRGAFDYITKPYNIDEIDLIIKRALQQRDLLLENKMLRETLSQRFPFSSIVSEDDNMKNILRQVQTLSNTDSTVLIMGESGTGKELIARALHYSGIRQNAPFVIIDCGGLTETILESEIFGHVKGAFTGAYYHKKGYLEVADGGSLFFDEIGELPYPLQKKLLRVIQEREFSKVGDTKVLKTNIRILTATNKNLKTEVGQRRFREDLYYRLNVISLQIPPLRERLPDIPLLANYFIREFDMRLNKRVTRITEEAFAKLMNYSWPGNIRELRNIIEKTMNFKEDETITAEDLPEEIRNLEDNKHSFNRPFKEIKKEAMIHVSKDYIKGLLSFYKGNVSKAALKAQMDRGNFRKLMKRFNVSAKEFR
jgi:two-component system, NtrC family, response regulator